MAAAAPCWAARSLPQHGWQALWGWSLIPQWRGLPATVGDILMIAVLVAGRFLIAVKESLWAATPPCRAPGKSVLGVLVGAP